MSEYEKGYIAYSWLKFSGLEGMTDDFKRGWMDAMDNCQQTMEDSLEQDED